MVRFDTNLKVIKYVGTPSGKQLKNKYIVVNSNLQPMSGINGVSLSEANKIKNMLIEWRTLANKYPRGKLKSLYNKTGEEKYYRAYMMNKK